MENSLEIQESQSVEPASAKASNSMSIRINWQSVHTTFNILNHILIAFVSIYMTYIAYSNGNVAISWHVFLCTIGVRLEFNFVLTKNYNFQTQ